MLPLLSFRAIGFGQRSLRTWLSLDMTPIVLLSLLMTGGCPTGTWKSEMDTFRV